MKSLHEKARIEYEKLKPVTCVVLGGETIYFYKSGFNHLIRKGKNPRPKKDVLRRIGMLSLVCSILRDAEAEVFCDQGDRVCFWRISKKYQTRIIIVVIRQQGNSPKHFFSVMDTKVKIKKSPTGEVF